MEADVIQAKLRARAVARREPLAATLEWYMTHQFLHRLALSTRSAKQPTGPRDSLLLAGDLLLQETLGRALLHEWRAELRWVEDFQPSAVLERVCQVCEVDSNDGLAYDGASVVLCDLARTRVGYEALVQVTGRLGSARCPVWLWVRSGDVVSPRAEDFRWSPALDGLFGARILGVPPVTTVAEMLQELVDHAMTFKRMQTLVDLLEFARVGEPNAGDIPRAIVATFSQRRTEIPDGVPAALSERYARDRTNQEIWRAFQSRNRLKEQALSNIIAKVRRVALPWLRDAERQQS
jgi:hypothetical protein